MTTIEPVLAAGIISALKQFVSATKLHPILVDFTAALVPVSVAADLAGRLRKDESLRNTAWWTLLFATVITPFTAITGWLFWMGDDNGVTGMAIHKWLGTGLVVLLFGLFAWRRNLYQQKQWASTAYLIGGAILVAALIIQGYLGGNPSVQRNVIACVSGLAAWPTVKSIGFRKLLPALSGSKFPEGFG